MMLCECDVCYNRELHATLSPRNVTELCYRHNGCEKANVFVSFQTLPGMSSDADKMRVREELAIKGYILESAYDDIVLS
jgi:hypothetical protein